jgi:FkbM family methyltransferase
MSITNTLGRGAIYAAIAVAGVAVGIAVAYGQLGHNPFGQMAPRRQPPKAPSIRQPSPVLNYCPDNWRDIAKPREQKWLANIDRMEKAARQVETTPDFGGLVRLETEKGSFWVPNKETHLLFDELAEMENGEYGIGMDDVQPNDVVLDCGAHFGAFTRHALDKGAKLVVAIDINPVVLECMKRTFAKDIADKRVIVFGKGVWNKEDDLPLEIPGGSEGSTVVLGGPTAGLKVPLTKIDTLFSDLRLPRVDFIKMDIEGSERPAIEGAADVIRRFKPRMAITTYHQDEDPFVLPRAVRAIDSEYWVRMPRCWQRSFRPPDAVPIPFVTFFRRVLP